VSLPTAEPPWVPLNARERRVAGVLVEKQKTTPDNYPMSIAAIVTGCNQKSNRDPITNYDADDVEDILNDLRRKGAAVMVEGGGRVVKWKHTLYDWLGLKGRAAEMAVLAELLLRGPQTEGELRQRADRMDRIPDLNALQTILAYLNELGLVVYLTPPGQRRGVVVTHGLYPPEELERIRQTQAQRATAEAEDERPARSAAAASPGLADEVAALRDELGALRAEVETLRAELAALKQTPGA
jgi:uncharacterized protein YceH (UPF0502 family)